MIDFHRPVQARSKYSPYQATPVTILTCEARGQYPVLGHNDDGASEEVLRWTKEGQPQYSSSGVLENVPCSATRFLALYDNGTVHTYNSKEEAEAFNDDFATAGVALLALKEVIVTEGEGMNRLSPEGEEG